MSNKPHSRKWFALGLAAMIGGLATLLLFRSLPIASGTAAVMVIAILALKHLGLALVIGSPLATLFNSIKPTLRAHCPFVSGGGGR